MRDFTAGLMVALSLWGAICLGVVFGVLLESINPYLAGMILGGGWTLWLTFVSTRTGYAPDTDNIEKEVRPTPNASRPPK